MRTFKISYKINKLLRLLDWLISAWIFFDFSIFLFLVILCTNFRFISLLNFNDFFVRQAPLEVNPVQTKLKRNEWKKNTNVKAMEFTKNETTRKREKIQFWLIERFLFVFKSFFFFLFDLFGFGHFSSLRVFRFCQNRYKYKRQCSNRVQWALQRFADFKWCRIDSSESSVETRRDKSWNENWKQCRCQRF